jgi:hypothetical protein
MLNELNQSIASQIASLYCPEGSMSLCESSLKARLNTYFDNTTFQYFLANLQSKGFFSIQLKQMSSPNHVGDAVFRLNTLDVVRGNQSQVDKIFPAAWFINGDINRCLRVFDQGFEVVKSLVTGGYLVSNSNFGYEIAYTGTPVGGGSTGSTGSGGSGDETRTPPGTVYVPGNDITPDPQTQTILQKQSSFDMNSLLIPGLLVAGILLLKDKF